MHADSDIPVKDDGGEDDKNDSDLEIYDNEKDEAGDEKDEDAVGEGEDPISAKPEPSEVKANSTPFYKFCCGLEMAWRASSKGEGWDTGKKLNTILPKPVLLYLDTPSEGSNRPESVYPLLRLLMPDKDTGARQFALKESTLAAMYSDALGFTKTNRKCQKLFQYTDPSIVPTKKEGLGDFSVVVQRVMESTKGKSRASGFTVGAINKALDDLIQLKSVTQKSNHDWRKAAADTSSGSPKKKKKPHSLKELRKEWLRKMNDDLQGRRGLSPLEHKWLVRIFLGTFNIGVGWKSILQWYHPYATSLWSAHNSLKGICDKLSDPEFLQAREQALQNISDEKEGLDSYMPKSIAEPILGTIFTPMLTERTGFTKILNDISYRHRDYINSSAARAHPAKLSSDCLAFKHPAFSVEPKLDGERFLVHVRRDGVVKMQTRQGNWYSELYCPGLGPPLRRAVRTGFDVILDGEVIAWDSNEKVTIPFGNNRSIARYREKYLKGQGELDHRDYGMHDGDTYNKSMNAANSWIKESDEEAAALAGKECWLQFVAFDVVYVDGADAVDLLSRVVSAHVQPRPVPGSIVHLDGFERRKMLLEVLTPQEHEVEIIRSWVVRPNGLVDSGENYFSMSRKECGHDVSLLDSQSSCLSGLIENFSDIDLKRRQGRSDEEISTARARAIQKLYNTMVEEQRLEGLVFKDLAAPYYLGDSSRSLKYWLKFKPDYFNGSVASDIDVIIIGGYFATGLRNSGEPSALLCACVDHENPDFFFPLCKVNAGSMDHVTRRELLIATGFRTLHGDDEKSEKTEREQKWFRLDKLSKEIPDFISKRSHQSNNVVGGWSVQKKDYPDLWINPANSFVVTLNAGEIVTSDAFSAGITLRFPRITRLRQGADSKRPCDISSDLDLHRKYEEVKSELSKSGLHRSTVAVGSPSSLADNTHVRFLTEDQLMAESGKKRARSTAARRIFLEVAVPSQTRVVSASLKGVSFTVLGKCTQLDPRSIDAEEGREQGWIQEAQLIKSSNDIKTFIRNHGGTYKISADGLDTFVLGGASDDSKVKIYIQAIERARSVLDRKPAKTKKTLELERIANSPGVLRWTFVFSIVHSWMQKRTDPEGQCCIRDDCPEILSPTALDYLSRPRLMDGKSTQNAELLDMTFSSASMMRRALRFVKQSASIKSEQKNWRSECIERMGVDQRWVVGCMNQTLWPYKRDQGPKTRVVMFADLFDEDGSRIDQYHKIAAALPLARVMGAFVVDDLDSEVTHILCDLKEGLEYVQYSHYLSEDTFANTRRGHKLISRLGDVRQSDAEDSTVQFVSPQWIRKRKFTRLGS